MRLRYLIPLLFVAACWAQCSSVCSGGALTGCSPAVSCSCGVTWDTNHVTAPSNNEASTYDVFYPTSLGASNTNRTAVYWHPGAWAGTLAQGYPAEGVICGSINQQTKLGAFYVPTYTVANVAYLTATATAGSNATMSLTSYYPSSPGWWPSNGSSLTVPMIVDTGSAAENVVINTIAGSGSAATFTVNMLASTHTINSFAMTSVAAASGSQTVYTGNVSANSHICDTAVQVIVTGFTNGANNGTFLCAASSATTLTLNNTAGVIEAHSGTIKNQIFAWFANTLYPVPLNDVAGLYAFLAHCAAGGTSPGSGTCSTFSTVPGNPLQITQITQSAGGTWAYAMVQNNCVTGSGCTYLNNNAGDAGKGYHVFSDTNWQIANPYGMPNISISAALDPPEVYTKAAVQGTGRLADNDGTGVLALCGCVPLCDNGNPASFTASTLTCGGGGPNTCYTTCQQQYSAQYQSTHGNPAAVRSWTCDGVGSGSCPTTTGVPTCTGGYDTIFCEADCIINQQPFMSNKAYPNGHGCGSTTIFTDSEGLVGGGAGQAGSGVAAGTQATAGTAVQ